MHSNNQLFLLGIPPIQERNLLPSQ